MSEDDKCPDSPDGKHAPDPASIAPADGAGEDSGTDWIVDIWCSHCGRSGSTQINPDDIQW